MQSLTTAHLHVGHLALQPDSGLLGQSQLLLVPLAELLQGVDLGLGGLKAVLQGAALQLHLLQLALETAHLLQVKKGLSVRSSGIGGLVLKL